MVQGPQLLVHAAIAIVALVVLIARYKLNPFVTLVIVSLALGVSVGMPMGGIVKAFETGVGQHARPHRARRRARARCSAR